MGEWPKLLVRLGKEEGSQTPLMKLSKMQQWATVQPSPSLEVSMDTRFQKVLRSSDAKSALCTLCSTTSPFYALERGRSTLVRDKDLRESLPNQN